MTKQEYYDSLSEEDKAVFVNFSEEEQEDLASFKNKVEELYGDSNTTETLINENTEVKTEDTKPAEKASEIPIAFNLAAVKKSYIEEVEDSTETNIETNTDLKNTETETENKKLSKHDIWLAKRKIAKIRGGIV